MNRIFARCVGKAVALVVVLAMSAAADGAECVEQLAADLVADVPAAQNPTAPPSPAPPETAPGTPPAPPGTPAIKPPLTVRQKLWYGLDHGFGPTSLLTAFAAGGYQQYFNQNEGYGQGADGYFARVGARYAKTATRHVLGSFMLASIFRQDPRYHRSQSQSKKARLGHALSRVVVTRGDNGRTQFNISEVGGTMGAAFISSTWYRPPDDTLSRAAQRGGFSLALDGARNVFREFWPDIRRMLGRRQRP